MRIIIAGGGTGGHIFPAIAIAQALKRQAPQCEILFVGAQGKMEMEKVPQAGFRIVGLPIAGFNRSSLIKNISLPLKLLLSFWKVHQLFRSHQPDAVIGVGGYSSFPVLRYAQAKGIPTFLHESNAFAGKSNILLGKKASLVFVATEGMERFFPAEKIRVSGNPVRKMIIERKVSREEANRFFGLDPAAKTVLVTGGSLGARGINEAIASGLEIVKKAKVQLIWQTGISFAPRAKTLTESTEHIWTAAFIPEMDQAFAAADLVVSRSGAMAIAELSIVGKPAILVPYPLAAEDHQTMNARQLVEKQAAWMVADREAAKELIPAIQRLLDDERLREQMSRNIQRIAITDADDRIAGWVLKQIRNKKIDQA
ncbi:MAG: hypothetical protein RL732_225 [Bacteroidota bacterium]